MNIFVCVDEDGGMLFNKRRQSKDRKVREKMFEIASGNPIFMNHYSSKQFDEGNDIIIDEEFLNMAGEDDFCFIENVDLPECGIKKLYIFNWNRKYPSDVRFDYNMTANGLKMLHREEFSGSSHENITLLVYGRE